MDSITELNGVIRESLSYKAKIMYINSAKREVVFIMYDSFMFKCQLDERCHSFGCGLQFSDGTISKNFLGRDISFKSDEKSIRKSLQIIDDYCRLRLPDKFLEAYYYAYVASQYDDCDM